MKLEHKTISFSVKALDDGQGLIEAYGSVFDVEDQGGDVVQPGAFKRTIQNSKARKEAGKAKFLATMLYQHDPDRPIGGWYDLTEDQHGLKCKGQIVLTTQLGRETYELIKAGVINEFSIGYDIPSGGATYDKSSGARLLKELRLWEISPVTFAMNSEALLTSVKGASGGSFPLAPDTTPWSKSKAIKDIEDVTGGDWSKAAKYFFWTAKSPPETEADCKLPFVCKVDGAMKAVPRAIETVAAVLQGSMGGANIDDVDAVKSKVASYYKKMGKTPPWDNKSVMTPIQRKDFNDHYRQASIEDWLYYDFNNLVNALKQSLIDEFMIGDEPEQDTVNTILNDSPSNKMGFISALKAWVEKGIQLDASNYLQETLEAHGMSGSPNYFMSNERARNMYTKDGRTISKATSDKLQAHIDNIRSMADEHKKAMNEHIKAMHSAADDLATILQGSESAYGTDEGKPETGAEGKAAPYTGTRGAQSHPLDNSTVDENELENALSILRSLRK
jgi:HK97 family phage prohead protease